MKTILNIIKKILFAFGFIYSLDLILTGANLFLPINYLTILVGTILGPLGIGAMFIIKMLI